MTLFKLKSAPLILVEDYRNSNTIPLLLNLTHDKSALNIFCYEQPVANWKNVFKDTANTVFFEEFNPDLYNKYVTGKCTVFVDSVNQMALCLGWNKCLGLLRKLLLDENVVQIILILHKDCLSHSSKLQIHLEHIASAIVSYDDKNPFKVRFQLKKNGKLARSEEMLSFDSKTSVLKSMPILKDDKKEDESEKPLPGNLSTFKIEVEQTEKLEKYKLKLPYMSKINEGESKVYYEPDAVDDWDEEDPDEDLDI